MAIVPIILCGGSGTRLWPLSRTAYPKQLLPLVDDKTMLQETIIRAERFSKDSKPVVICNEAHRFLVAEQLLEVSVSQPYIMLEPEGKNTAPAVTLAALHLMALGQDPVLLVLPADHVIKDSEEFKLAIEKGRAIAEQGRLVTFGVKPIRAETGYGYIKTGKKSDIVDVFAVEKFVEKPDVVTAQHYVDSGNYFWNSGMFMFRASSYLKEMETYATDILADCQKTFVNIIRDLDFFRLPQKEFANCRSESIDYAIMEKSDAVSVVVLNSDWSDVGSWNALWEIKEADNNGNVTQGDIHLSDVKNSYIHAETRMIAVVGVSDHVIIETADAVLVTHKDYCQNVKALVSSLKKDKRSEVELHRRVHRPWGYYEVLDFSKEFQVKRIMVKPGQRLSLQSHKFRSEHWVVIEGTALVTRGEECITLTMNQSTYIPIGMRHRLENKTHKELVIVEVQCGEYIGEDDIERFEDVYGRVPAPIA